MPHSLDGCTCAHREVPLASYPFPRLKVKPPDPPIPFASRARNAVPGCLPDLTQPFFSLAIREPRTKGDDVMWSLPTIFAGSDFLTNRKSARVQLFFFNQSRAFSRVAGTNGWGPIFPFSVGDCKKTTQSVAHGPTLPQISRARKVRATGIKAIPPPAFSSDFSSCITHPLQPSPPPQQPSTTSSLLLPSSTSSPQP